MGSRISRENFIQNYFGWRHHFSTLKFLLYDDQPNILFWNFSLMSMCSLLIVQYTYFRFSWKLSCHWIINTLKFLLWEANQVVLRGPNVCKSWDCQDHFSYFSKNQWSYWNTNVQNFYSKLDKTTRVDQPTWKLGKILIMPLALTEPIFNNFQKNS